MTKTVNLVMEIAQQMIEAGAEIGRVEESVTRMGQAYGYQTDAYATTSSIIVTFQRTQDDSHTLTRRIRQSSLDVERLHQLNDLVRFVTNTTPESQVIEDRLENIRKIAVYPLWLYLLSCATIAGSFCAFFGSRDLWEILFAFLIGGGVGASGKGIERIHPNKILGRFLSSFLASVSALILLRLGWVASVDNIIIGNIMSLIPGIGLTNSLRDLFTGDTVTGLLRFMEAVLLALAIALGFWIAVYVCGGLV